MPSPDASAQDFFELVEKLNQFKTSQDTVVTRLTAVSSDISRQIKDVRTELAEFARDKENVRNMAFKLEVLDAEVAKLRTKLGQSDESIEASLKDETAVRGKVAELMGKVVELGNRVQEAESGFLSRMGQLESASAELSRLSIAVSKLDEAWAYNERGDKGTSARLAQAQAAIGELKAALARVASAGESAGKELGIVKKSLAGFTEDIGSLNGRLSDLSSRLDAAATERSSLKRDLAELRNRFDGLEANVSTAFLIKDELGRAKRDLADQQERVKDLQKVSTQIIAKLAEEEDVVKDVLDKEAKRRMSTLERTLTALVDERVRSFTARLDEESKAVEARALALEEWSKRMAAKEKDMDDAIARFGMVSEADFAALRERVAGIGSAADKLEKAQERELKMASDRLDRDHERLKALELKTDKAVELVKELTEQLGRVNDKLDLLQF